MVRGVVGAAILLVFALGSRATATDPGPVSPEGSTEAVEIRTTLDLQPLTACGKGLSSASLPIPHDARDNFPLSGMQLPVGRYAWSIRVDGKAQRLGKLFVL